MQRADSFEKTLMLGKIEGRRRRGRQRMRWLDGITDSMEFEWTPGVGDGQGGLACCNSWGRKESDVTEQLNWTELKGSLRRPQFSNHVRFIKALWGSCAKRWASCMQEPGPHCLGNTVSALAAAEGRLPQILHRSPGSLLKRGVQSGLHDPLFLQVWAGARVTSDLFIYSHNSFQGHFYTHIRTWTINKPAFVYLERRRP